MTVPPRSAAALHGPAGGGIVVMGVSGSGKSTVGAALAARLDWAFLDGDDLHPPASITKMRGGEPLTDEDRRPWLQAVGRSLAHSPAPVVVACSALRRAYRDIIREDAPATYFVHLVGSRALLADRLAARTGHFMPSALLASQLDLVEPLDADEAGTAIDVTVAPRLLVDELFERLRQR